MLKLLKEIRNEYHFTTSRHCGFLENKRVQMNIQSVLQANQLPAPIMRARNLYAKSLNVFLCRKFQ